VPSLTILVSAVLVLSCEQFNRMTESHTEANDRYTHETATTVGVSNDGFDLLSLRVATVVVVVGMLLLLLLLQNRALTIELRLLEQRIAVVIHSVTVAATQHTLNCS